MFPLFCLPQSIRTLLEPLRPHFRWSHFLTFCWLLTLQMLQQGPANLRQLSRYGPLRYAKYCRLLRASYWDTPEVWLWFVRALLAVLPIPLDRTLYVVADSSHKPKRSRLNPYAKQGKAREPGFFGLHFLVISLQWLHFRIPVAFALIRSKKDPHYLTENTLFRQLLQNLTLPMWAKQVVIIADAAYASKANLRYIQSQGWFYLMALAKTWNLADGTPLKTYLAKLQRHQFKQTWLTYGSRRRWFYVRQQRLNLNVLGEVTILFSKKGRKDGPKATKCFVTNLPDSLTERQLLQIYQRRWQTEVLFKELKSGLGLGEHQVTKDPGRVERSVKISLMAYLLLVRLQQSQQPSWSIFAFKQELFWQVLAEQITHSRLSQLQNWLQQRISA